MEITIDARAALWYKGTGMGTYARDLLKGLRQVKKYKINTLLADEQISLAAGLTYIETNGEEKKNFWELVQERPPVLSDNCGVFHNLHNGFGFPPALPHGSVVTIHDLIPLIMPEHCGSPYRENFPAEIKKAANAADKIIAVSQCTKKDIINILHIPSQKIEVIYQAPANIFQPLNINDVKKKLAEKYNITEKYFLYVGGFNPRKNLPRLINAFSMIQEEVPWNLVIGGRRGKQAQYLEAKAEQLIRAKRVIFTDYIPTDDMPIFYNGAELFIYPSLYEGFGLPPLEAAACGKAVILSKAASLPEVMGNSAVYIDPQSEKDIAKAIISAYHWRKDLASLARESQNRAKLFSIDKTTQKTLEIYENLCR